MAERFSIDRSPLSDKDQEKAKTELRETPEVRAAELVKLRKLVQGGCNFFIDEVHFN